MKVAKIDTITGTILEIVDEPDPAENYYTAEDYLKLVGFGGDRQPTLLYLLIQLNALGKSSLKLNQAQSWLNMILFTYANDFQTRTSEQWGQPPHTFEEVVADAISSINS